MKITHQTHQIIQTLLDELNFYVTYASQTRNNLLTGQPVKHVDLDSLDDTRMKINRIRENLKLEPPQPQQGG